MNPQNHFNHQRSYPYNYPALVPGQPYNGETIIYQTTPPHPFYTPNINVDNNFGQYLSANEGYTYGSTNAPNRNVDNASWYAQRAAVYPGGGQPMVPSRQSLHANPPRLVSSYSVTRSTVNQTHYTSHTPSVEDYGPTPHRFHVPTPSRSVPVVPRISTSQTYPYDVGAAEQRLAPSNGSNTQLSPTSAGERFPCSKCDKTFSRSHDRYIPIVRPTLTSVRIAETNSAEYPP
ncbi:hypothetical protein FISHEDRAFT_57509 [Fistulina hepatica ATCC 64428]|uniref:Uncharacterized protein n=1 Tax=Fistulina hepatica ATCC 64428 TaxID=1128425 RepID=A0A0D7AFQ6_9AGAR|nr:hypothetical protein FISHEDRAFT_57509 [Fistulina hepatica ATCC 64428]